MTGPLVTLSMGMGIDSAAILTRWMLDPTSRLVPDPTHTDPDTPAPLVPFELGNLTVVTAMTGDEYERTGQVMEEYLLPLMTRYRVRYVQVCRAGQSDSAGIVILSDSRDTRRMTMRGPWRLADELHAAGTVPQVAAGKRLCSYRAKGWVLDRWAEMEYAGATRVHVIGFAAEEVGRAQRDSSYTQEARTPDYPLIRWGWDREHCAAYLRELYGGVDWPRSCCGYCPFQAGPELHKLRERWEADPAAAVEALMLESTALALNPRMALFGDRTARQVAFAFGLGHLVEEAAEQLARTPHALYEVRRIFRRAGDQRAPGIFRRAGGGDWVLGPDPYAKGQVWRSLRQVGGVDTRARLVDDLRRRHAEDGGELEPVTSGSARLWFARATAPYPGVERYLTVARAGVADKERAAFDELWAYVAGLGLDRQGDLLTEGLV